MFTLQTLTRPHIQKIQERSGLETEVTIRFVYNRGNPLAPYMQMRWKPNICQRPKGFHITEIEPSI